MLEVRKTIDQGTLIDIIAAGIPNFIMDKINKEEILETQDLFNEIGKLEHLVNKNKTSTKKGSQKVTTETKQKCGICEKLQKGISYHSESSCWFKTKENDPGKQIKIINNSELECELQDQNKKNF